MAEPAPLNGMRYAHKTIRRELKNLEAAAAHLDFADEAAAAALHEHVVVLGALLRGHTDGEEAVLWPALEAKFPQITTPYTLDHRAEQAHVARILDLLVGLKQVAPREAREHLKYQLHHETIAIEASTTLHADKEDVHLIPLTERTFDLPTQAALAGGMAAHLPNQYMPQSTNMMMQALDPAERADYVGMLAEAMPPQAFAATKALIENALSPAEWQDLKARVPQLA